MSYTNPVYIYIERERELCIYIYMYWILPVFRNVTIKGIDDGSTSEHGFQQIDHLDGSRPATKAHPFDHWCIILAISRLTCGRVADRKQKAT